ncbi:hypothetical protein [Hymenobacter properus]|uniref:Uncharacterized protein n=1 Tax=Hymenobacter properus TaxID=2791026 RepID=A0A931FMU5_9BACT|nr:hypothetical protein [Hymenobacter properus]MBF9142004.1 hypothetical protein [Hymenobacter properus]MBR7720811.1 hypothetical protein [Microvirga sp. SRT04]
MPDRLITLCYRKIIDATATRPWDKLVWGDSYTEFRLQAQNFNPENRYRSFGEMLHYVPGAERLHFLVSGAVTGYVQQLSERMPDIFNNLGRQFLRFNRFQFELINSDLQDKSKHQVAVNFVSTTLRWHDTVGQLLLVSDAAPAAAPGGEVLTHLVQLQAFLSIYSIQTPETDAPANAG